MPVGSNDIRVNDAFISLTANGDAEEQLPPNTPIFLRVDVEAGTNAFQLGIAYRLHVILLDITASYTNRFFQIVRGHLNSPGDPWNARDVTFTFPIPPLGPVTTPGPDSLLRIEAVLTSGVSGQGVDVFESPTVVVTD